MRIAPILSILLLTTACDSAGDKVAKRYATAEASGAGLEDLCVLARDTADAYLKAEDQKNYSGWSTKAAEKCAASDAASDRQYARERQETRSRMQRQENLERAGLR